MRQAEPIMLLNGILRWPGTRAAPDDPGIREAFYYKVQQEMSVKPSECDLGLSLSIQNTRTRSRRPHFWGTPGRVKVNNRRVKAQRILPSSG